MQNNLCPHCSGRGFIVKVRSDYGIDYARNNVCEVCNGSGRLFKLNCLAIIALGLLAIGAALALSFYVIYPLIKLWLD